MLSHLCEFGKLSPDAKKFHKKLSKLKSKSVFSNSLLENNNRYYLKHKLFSPMKEPKDKMKLEMRKSCPINYKEGERSPRRPRSIFDRNTDFMELVELMPDFEFYKKTKELKKENEEMQKTIRTILEINHKKILRYENTFKNTNYRNKIEISQRNIANSFNLLQKINPKMNNKTYISYFPFKDEFIDLKTGEICNLKSIKEYKTKENKSRNIAQCKPILTEINKNQEKHIKYNPFFS